MKKLAHIIPHYGRILEQIGHDGEKAGAGFWECFKDCKDPVDVVLVVEG
jgi:hypothetical protein